MRTFWPVIIALFLLSGCAGSLDYKKLGTHMRADQCSLAVNYVKEHEKDYGANQRLLFLLDAAMINMMCGNSKASNRYYHSAEKLADELWTKSFSKEAVSFLVNDYTIPYAGEEFERALINLFAAVNYVRLGQNDEALVECRRLDATLNVINDKYEKKNVYKEDAFARYLSGIIYEADRNMDDAFIDYRKALQVFKDYQRNYGTPVPRVLLEDLSRVAEVTGRTAEARSLSRGLNSAKPGEWRKKEGMGRIVFIHFNGRSPVKKDRKLHIPTKEGPVTLAFPKYQVNRPRCRQSKVIVESRPHRWDADTELMEDINAIAVKNLKDREIRITAKTIARGVSKQAAIREFEDERVQQVLNIINTLIVEQADKRTWRTLPGEIRLSRIFLPEGEYNVYVSQCGGSRKRVEHVNLKEGEIKFVLYESMY